MSACLLNRLPPSYARTVLRSLLPFLRSQPSAARQRRYKAMHVGYGDAKAKFRLGS